MMRRRFIGLSASWLLMGLVSPLLRAQGSGQGAVLRMGIHPYNSTLALLGTHRPLVQYLEKMLEQSIEFSTAPNFDAYHASLMAGEYDLVIAPPHFAVQALQKGYVSLYQYKSRLEPLYTVKVASPLHEARQFRGKKIAMADPSALIRIAAIKWLEDQGLQAGRDYQIIEKPTHGASIAAAAVGEVDIGLTTGSGMAQVPADIRQQVRTISTGIRLPHLVTLAHRRLGEPKIERLRTVLAAMPATPEGRDFFTRMPVHGYEPFTEADQRAMEPYVQWIMKQSSKKP